MRHHVDGPAAVAQWLIERGPDAQDRALVNLEGAVDRPELANDLDRLAPVVPLRGAVSHSRNG